MFNGGLIGLVSGGYIDVAGHKREKGERRQQRRELRYERRYGPRADYQGFADDGLSPARNSHSPYSPNRQDQDYFARGHARRQHPADRRAAREARGGGPLGVIKKVMQEDVLYLMIVPMPSEEELAEAREMLAMEKEKK